MRAIGAAIKETVKQPCEKCSCTGRVATQKPTAESPNTEIFVACLGTGFRRFPGARLVRSRHVRCE